MRTAKQDFGVSVTAWRLPTPRLASGSAAAIEHAYKKSKH
jgi:hypothetical protein